MPGGLGAPRRGRSRVPRHRFVAHATKERVLQLIDELVRIQRE